jgi:cytidine deaminase
VCRTRCPFHAGAIYPEAKICKMAITAASGTNENNSPIPPWVLADKSIAEYEINKKHLLKYILWEKQGDIYKSVLKTYCLYVR